MKRGYSPLTVCRNGGHDMSVYRRVSAGNHSYCAECKLIGSRKYPARKTSPTMNRKLWLKRAYGIDQTLVDAMLDVQDHKCAICRAEFGIRGPHVDHDHATGVVRGLLCKQCNTGIGLFADDTERLKMAIKYLKH